jgi:magnesium transporter
MIRSIFCNKHGPRQVNLKAEEIARVLQEPDGVLWISLEQPTGEEIQDILHSIFRFHPLAIEDTQSTGYQPPKVDDFDSYLFILVHALKPNSFLTELETLELNCFLGPNYLVTSYKSAEMPPVQEVWELLNKDERLLDRGADFLCHAVLDHLVDAYMPVIDDMDEEIDRLEDQVLARPHPAVLQRILTLKHSTLTLRRIIAPQREVMNRLSRDEFPPIQAQNRIYYRDIYDHLVRIQDLSESVRDIVTGTLDTYLSASSNRLNEVMKALTIVSTIFLPLSFVAGVYGMNFEFMPELHWRYGYLIVWAIFLGLASVMLWLFRRRGWL